jgi:hypothetical protein
MMFTVLGAVAELERSLIVERCDQLENHAVRLSHKAPKLFLSGLGGMVCLFLSVIPVLERSLQCCDPHVN